MIIHSMAKKKAEKLKFLLTKLFCEQGKQIESEGKGFTECLILYIVGAKTFYH